MQRMRPHIQTPEPDHREKEARKLRLAPIPGGVGADTQGRSTDQARKGGGWEAPGNASRAEGFSGDATKPGNASGDSGHEPSVCKHVLLELPVPYIHTGFLNRVLTWLLKGPTIIASSGRYSYNFSLNFFSDLFIKTTSLCISVGPLSIPRDHRERCVDPEHSQESLLLRGGVF